MSTAQIYITDKSGKRFFNTLCSVDYVAPERRNLQRHLAQALKHPEQYRFLDLETAKIVCEGEKLTARDFELLKQLGAI